MDVLKEEMLCSKGMSNSNNNNTIIITTRKDIMKTTTTNENTNASTITKGLLNSWMKAKRKKLYFKKQQKSMSEQQQQQQQQQMPHHQHRQQQQWLASEERHVVDEDAVANETAVAKEMLIDILNSRKCDIDVDGAFHDDETTSTTTTTADNNSLRLCLLCRQEHMQEECCMYCSCTNAEATILATTTRTSLQRGTNTTGFAASRSSRSVGVVDGKEHNQLARCRKAATATTSTLVTHDINCWRQQSSCKTTAATAATSNPNADEISLATTSSVSTSTSSTLLSITNSATSSLSLSSLATLYASRQQQRHQQRHQHQQLQLPTPNTLSSCACDCSNSNSTRTATATTSVTTNTSHAAKQFQCPSHIGTNDNYKLIDNSRINHNNNNNNNNNSNNNQIRAKHSAKRRMRFLIENTLRTFQFLILCIQMHLNNHIFNKFLYYYYKYKRQQKQKRKLQQQQHQHQQQHQQHFYLIHKQQQQQRPPFLRLKFRRNSYFYNYNNLNNKFSYNNYYYNDNENNDTNHHQHKNNKNATNNYNNNQASQSSSSSSSIITTTAAAAAATAFSSIFCFSILKTSFLLSPLLSFQAPMQKHQQHQRQLQQQHQYRQQQLQQQHKRRYFKMPNLSFLYIILIVLSFLSLILPSTYAQNTLVQPPQLQPRQQQSPPSLSTSLATLAANKSTIKVDASQEVRLARNETVCKTTDIRNQPILFQQLENCTVIEGFLLISLLNMNDFSRTFPLLTEITDYLIVYRVHFLHSLSQIFPNLSVIRGRSLFEGYALIIYMNPHLEDIGLSKLISVERGGVRIENNLSLCYVETIDWSLIVSNTTDIVKKKNRLQSECPSCPGDIRSAIGPDGVDNDLVCRESAGRRRCWNSKSCQKICPERCRNNCLDENHCCNESCIGGCSANNLNECTSCRHFSIHNNACTDKCPADFYSYIDRRCITADMCIKQIGFKYENNKEETLVPFNGACRTNCPPGFNKVGLTCQSCGDRCTKKCTGIIIDSVSRANDIRGCTHIVEEGITISIKRGGRHLMEELEASLSSIQVISTYVKIHRTYGIFSLSFFKNLKVIEGKVLYEDKFALYVLENNDLETIWGPNRTVHIAEGRVFFHFNPRLCLSEIEALLPMMKNNTPFNKNEVAEDSNGSKGSCGAAFLNTTITILAPHVAQIRILNPITYYDDRVFIGYQIFYIEDEFKNATKYGHRVCDDGWISNEPTKELDLAMSPLEPYTQYAYYVKTMTISSEKQNAQSPILYFKTLSAQPIFRQTLTAFAKSDSEIVLKWGPPRKVNGKLTQYKIRAQINQRGQDFLNHNYCKEPPKELQEIDAERFQPVTEKPKLTEVLDCTKCTKNKNGFYDDVDDDAVRHDRIDFENSLQNFMYVKQKNRTVSKADEGTDNSHDENEERRRRRRHNSKNDGSDSYLLRHMRFLPNEIDNGGNSINGDFENEMSALTTTNLHLIDDTTISPLNETAVDTVDGNLKVVVNASVLEYVFTGLKHFSIYTLYVEACRAPDGSREPECSEPQVAYVRTQKLKNVDKVENLMALLEVTNTSRSNVRMRWDPPERPNGAVVSYTIAYLMLAQDAVEEKKCITELDFRNMTNGYLLTGLSTGNYSIRVRANSLAGEGIFSEPVYMYIPDSQLSPLFIGIIVVIVLLIMVTICLLVYCYLRKRYTKPTDLRIFPTVNPYYISLQYIPDDWEVPREKVIQLNSLGQGSFGMVYEGILKGSSRDTPCAIKTVNENATDRERMNFLNEASVMKQFDTYHVVRLLGVCSRGQPALVIMELMGNGDLKSYLRAHRPDEHENGLGFAEHVLQPPPLRRIYQMAIEIADGMSYLSAKKFVHRDLAARNCMVASDLTVKIGDFGMTRDIYETDYYRKGTKGLLPVRWMPPESLRDGIYSSASDVFSYGVVLWEMATLASQPYQGLSNDQVLRYVIDGGVMERPENCSDSLYRLMQKCWHHRPTARPTFLEIIQFLEDYADSHFREVSFYHSEDGKHTRAKEAAEKAGNSGDIFNDNENDVDDVTTPLRMDEYTESVENRDNDEDPPHSPYSQNSAVVTNSTPDGQSKRNARLLQMIQQNKPNTSHGSAPTVVAEISGSNIQHPHPHTHPHQRQLHQPQSGRFPYHPQQHADDDSAAYVLPDYDPKEAKAGASKSVETDERGYEIYNPSPNYRVHAPYNAGAEEEDGEEGLRSSMGRTSKLSGTENLLPRQKVGRQRVPVIMPMSSSMPDEAVAGAAISSSLHPSTASAASSNASSITPTTGKTQPSLKKAVTGVVQNVSTLMPARLRNINRRFFNHKRTGSNASHKSTTSNPNTSSNSNANLTSGSSGLKSTSGQNLGTIESGGSESTSSYSTGPRFFTAISSSENPNYKILDEAANTSGVSNAGATATPPKTILKAKAKPSTYQLLNESLNTTAETPAKSSSSSGLGTTAIMKTTENPNYHPTGASVTGHTTYNPNYTEMTAPNYQESIPAATTHMTENPNYQPSEPRGASTLPFAMSPPDRLGRLTQVYGTSSSGSMSTSDDDDDNDPHTENIKLERMPLSGQRNVDRPTTHPTIPGSRSRSQSQNKGDGKSTPVTTASLLGGSGGDTTVTTKPSTYSLKEKWLRHQQQPPPPPPPNGFIGATTTPTQQTTTAKKI